MLELDLPEAKVQENPFSITELSEYQWTLIVVPVEYALVLVILPAKLSISCSPL